MSEHYYHNEIYESMPDVAWFNLNNRFLKPLLVDEIISDIKSPDGSVWSFMLTPSLDKIGTYEMGLSHDRGELVWDYVIRPSNREVRLYRYLIDADHGESLNSINFQEEAGFNIPCRFELEPLVTLLLNVNNN